RRRPPGAPRASGPRGGAAIMSLSHRRIEISNTLGLHLRAAHQFVRQAQRFQAEIRVHQDGQSVNGKSVLELLTLAATSGTWLDLEASGLDAHEALIALSELIEARFHEDGLTDASAVAVEQRADT